MDTEQLTWRVYIRQQDSTRTWVSYINNIRERLDELPRTLVKVDITLEHARDGLPGARDFQTLELIEDALDVFARERDGLNVGRSTGGGRRSIYMYVDVPPEQAERVAVTISEETGYDLDVSVTADPNHTGYLSALYPDERGKNIESNLMVLEQLRQVGDPLESPRPIDHWAYFETQTAASQYSAWLAARGFRVDPTSSPEEAGGSWGVGFHNDMIPDLFALSDLTLELRAHARHLSGDYDGWGTMVIKE